MSGKNTTYNKEITALKPHCQIVELQSGQTRVAIAPELQGRVLTSCTSTDKEGFGWINHALIASGQMQPHLNAYGGEDRFWIGPEAGQYAVFFKPGDAFLFENWQTPACIDSEPFSVKNRTETTVTLGKTCQLVNYQNQQFDIEIVREIEIFDRKTIAHFLPNIDLSGVETVAFNSKNQLYNRAKKPWQKETGLLNIWILGKFKPADSGWAIIPTTKNAFINQNYFEADLSKRLIETPNYSLLHVDGSKKAKIGIAPQHDKNVLGSFDFEKNELTVVTYQTDKNQVFLNSEWCVQPKPYSGDVLNVYNDGPNPDGSILGPYYELETSSSSRELQPNEHIAHVHNTFHFTGALNQLNQIAQSFLDVDLHEIKRLINER